jgi:hypothetical protein
MWGIQMTIQIGRLGNIVLSAFVMMGTAGAADLRVATPPPPAFNWSGCYVGGFVSGLGEIITRKNATLFMPDVP